MTASTTTTTAAQKDWEETAYPTAPETLHLWMREQRGMIRAFLDSRHGRTQSMNNTTGRSKSRVRAN